MRSTKCLNCKKGFKVKPYRKSSARFCSRLCYGIYKSKNHVPWNKGKKNSQTAWNKGMVGYRAGKKHPWMAKGSKHYNWKGGISSNPYPKEFNSVLKLKIRERDDFACCLCGRTEREELEELGRVLCVNHIDFDKKNCSERNLNTLCCRCNVRINREREYWTQHFNQTND